MHSVLKKCLACFLLYNTNQMLFFFSDTIGNKGAFITLNGKDMIPSFTTYEAVVSIVLAAKYVLSIFIFVLATSERETHGVRKLLTDGLLIKTVPAHTPSDF